MQVFSREGVCFDKGRVILDLETGKANTVPKFLTLTKGEKGVGVKLG